MKYSVTRRTIELRWWEQTQHDWYSSRIRVRPVWVCWALWWWDCRWLPFLVLTRLGFWSVREGALYTSGHWTWRWWRTLSAYYRTARAFGFPRSRWERFGWKLEVCYARFTAGGFRWE